MSKHLNNDNFRLPHLIWLLFNEGKPGYARVSAIYEALVKWEHLMTQKTYRIELKLDLDNDTNHEVMLGIAKQYARDLLGSAMLLQDKRKPSVALMTDDSFTGYEDIDILEQSENLHT